MREAVEKALDAGNTYGNITIVLDYPLSLTDLQQYGGTVYYDESDTLISTSTLDDMPPHPASVDGGNIVLLNTHIQRHQEFGFGYSINLVDTAGKYGPRYLNIGGKVYRINPVKDPTRRDGIYVMANAPAYGDMNIEGHRLKVYAFEGAEEKLGLYKSSEEAFALGDLALANKGKILELEAEVQRAKKENMLQKEDFDRKASIAADLARQANVRAEDYQRTLERTRLEEKLAFERKRDEYDEKAHKRKDTSEFLKFLPALIVGLGALVPVLKVLFPAVPIPTKFN